MTETQYERFNKIKDYLKANFDKKTSYKIKDINNNYITIHLRKLKKRSQVRFALIRELNRLKAKDIKLDFDNKIDISITKKKIAKKKIAKKKTVKKVKKG